MSETKKDDEVLDENIDYDASEEADTELEDNYVMDFGVLTIPGAKYYITTEIIELQLDDEVLDNVAVLSTGSSVISLAIDSLVVNSVFLVE